MVHNITWKNFAMLIYDFDDFLAKIIATFNKVNQEKVENTKIDNEDPILHWLILWDELLWMAIEMKKVTSINSIGVCKMTWKGKNIVKQLKSDIWSFIF